MVVERIGTFKKWAKKLDKQMFISFQSMVEKAKAKLIE